MNSGGILDDLVFSLNATIPIFLMILLGFGLKKTGMFDEKTSLLLSRFSFKILLPVMLFHDLSQSEFISIWDNKMILFCLLATALSVGISWAFSLFHKNKTERGEIIQACYRSSAAILGVAFVINIYGSAHKAALMMIGTIPLYNIIAVTVLSVTSPDRDKSGSKAKLIKTTALNVLKNPIIIGIALGVVWSLLKLPQPVIMERSLKYVGNMATPLSLISLGALFEVSKAKGKIKLSFIITFIKLMLFCMIFLPIAVWMGFRDESLVAILVMLGSATTSSCFVMAKNLGHEGVITSCSVMLTTFFSSLTLTLWLFILKTFELV